MQASAEHIELLEKLQEVDRVRIMAQDELAKLPHREQVEEGRRKRAEIKARADSLAQILSEVSGERQRLRDEYERLGAKLDETQEKINQTSGDYRGVAQLTRDLDGIRKRRETIEFETGKADARIAEVRKVKDQADQALEALASREEALAADYHEKSEALAARARAATQARTLLVAKLPDDIAQRYEEAAKRCKGIGLARLRGTTCQACRSAIDPARLISVRAEAPLSRCPSCGRLLVVGEADDAAE